MLFLGAMQLLAGRSEKEFPRAVRGALDLSSWDFHRDGKAELNGEWEFYPNRLLAPEDFRGGAAPEAGRYIQVPSKWNGEGMGAWGAGTYRLKVRLNPTEELLAIQKTIVRFSDKLFVNGELVGQAGEPGLSRSEYRPGNYPYTVSFKGAPSGEMEIVLQAANFEYRSGGIVVPIRLGLSKELLLTKQAQIALEWAGVIVMSVFALVYISLYLLFNRYSGFMIYGLFFLFFAITVFFNGERTFMQLFPDVPFEVTWKIKDFSMFIIYPILCVYVYQQVRTRGSRRLILISGSLMAAYSVCILVLPYRVYALAMGEIFAAIPLEFVLLVGLLVRAYLKGDYDVFGKRELQLLIASFLSITLFLVNTFLYNDFDFVSQALSDLLVIVFIMLSVMTLVNRYFQTYRSMEDLTRKLQAADQMKDEFLLRASHELNTPLHGILNLSQAAIDESARTSASRRIQEKLRLIRNTAYRMANIVGDVVDLTKLKDGRLDLALARVDARTCASVLFEVYGFLAKEKEIALLNRIGDEARYVRTDQKRFMQVLTNLFDQVVRHTERGDVSIVSRRTEEDEIVLRIEANGQPREPGADSPSDPVVFGIGLSVAKELIQRMGGSLEWSDPAAGAGMSFELALPAWPEAPAAEEPLRQAEEARRQTAAGQEPGAGAGAGTGADPDIGAYSLLVVGDPSGLELAVNLLAIEGYRVATARSAAEALRIVSAPDSRPDLVLIDVMLHGEGGFEVGRRIRQTHSPIDLPIVYLTARTTPADIEAALAAGGSDFIAKPLDAGEVRVRISALLAMKRLAKEAAASEMAFLQSQIKPHFLYNALGTIMSLCYTDGPRAGELLAVLSRYLRIIFHPNHSEETVPLHKEMELVQAYADIEQARFGSRLRLRFEVDERLLDIPVMPLTIQPLVENAIRHGVARKVDGGTVRLAIARENEYARIEVEDDGVGMSAEQAKELLEAGGNREGVGFANIMKRVLHRTGRLPQLESVPGQGTKVTIWLPLSDTYR
ncbi:histidine kinase [Cohnella xylanilytica]|uniref:histidine kinase n=1 Tax=Cohnella xylanilytica TaxID=557555 RepID=A0A841U0R1_9BACL|nr:ATP-binding protein [Cohnella xylanilytica]MBB6691514.1 histidine kinase [Cohnella xylanilytica]